MQPIERYGVIALLLLVVIIAAVVLWDQSEAPLEVQAGGTNAVVLEGLSRESVAANVSKSPQLPKGVNPAKRTSVADKTERPEKPAFQTQGWEPESADQAARLRKDESARFLEQVARAERELKSAPEVVVPVDKTVSSRLAGNLIEPGPKTAPKGPANKQVARSYKVQPGDTMGQIAIDQLGTIQNLKLLQAANPSVDPARMSVGTNLVLPEVPDRPAGSGLASTSAPVKDVVSPKSGGRTYQVEEGDSLWSIASRLLGDGNRYREIAELNPKVNPDVLLLGQSLVLPAGSAPVATAKRSLTTSVSNQTVASATPKKGVVR